MEVNEWQKVEKEEEEAEQGRRERTVRGRRKYSKSKK